MEIKKLFIRKLSGFKWLIEGDLYLLKLLIFIAICAVITGTTISIALGLYLSWGIYGERIILGLIIGFIVSFIAAVFFLDKRI